MRFNKEYIDEIIALRNEKQLDTLQEEAAELIQAISKYRRCKDGDNYLDNQKILDNVKEEIADVYLTIENAKTILNISDKEIEDIIKFKQERLHNRIKTGEIK